MIIIIIMIIIINEIDINGSNNDDIQYIFPINFIIIHAPNLTIRSLNFEQM